MTFNVVSNNKMNSFENLLSKVSFWNVDLPKSPLNVDEDSEESDVLCELVRNQYLKRLRQTLLNNLENSKCYQNVPFDQIQQYVDVCIAKMEKQALRRCMIASIYRESMSNMINKVKICTNNSIVYILLEQIIESNNQLSLHDAYFGTNAYNIKKHSVSTYNTEAKSNKTISTQTERWMDLDSNLSNNFIIDNNKKTPNSVTDIVNKSNLSSSPFVKSEISKSNIFENLNSLLKSSSCSSSSSDISHAEMNNMYESSEFSSLSKNSEQNDCLKNNLSGFSSLLRDLQDSPEYEQSSKLEEHLISLGLEVESHKSKNNVSESVTSVHINPNVIRSNKIEEILKNKLKSLVIGKKYELQKSIKELPQELQRRLDQRFLDLFGNSHDYESDLLSNEEERIIAHKRIIKMVVKFMIPYYKANRINRDLFKDLAKFISKNLMNRTYDQDEKTVARAVNEFFIGNRCYKTTEDIYL